MVCCALSVRAWQDMQQCENIFSVYFSPIAAAVWFFIFSVPFIFMDAIYQLITLGKIVTLYIFFSLELLFFRFNAWNYSASLKLQKIGVANVFKIVKIYFGVYDF